MEKKMKEVGYYEYLAKIRKENKELFSICQFCKKPSEDIISDGYRIYPVCKNHRKEQD